ncbi:chitin synthase, partial [Jimgerdemannia flammicorona]
YAISGITGSGKTTSHNHLINELLLLATHGKKEAKIKQQIVNAQTITECFGNARTVQNRSASRFGKFQELQFNERGRIIGAKTLTYFFDKTRVTEVPRDERTYHAFYAMFAGTSVDEKNALHINFAPEHFNYLAQSKVIKVADMDDQIAFGDLKAALKSCGFKAKTTMQIFQLLAAILHLGNLQFVDNRDNAQATQDACSIRNRDVLEQVAAMLGVSAIKLETTLTYKLKLIRKELCTVFLNAAGATEQRDSLARALYSVLFAWIVETINTKLCFSSEPANFVGVLDQFGFQNFKNNSFEQFCVNFANERAQQFVINQLFDDNAGINAVMTRDGVSLPTVITMDNAGCVELLTGKDKIPEKQDSEKKANLAGMIGLLDREAARFQSGASDASDANLLSGFQRQFSTHPSFAKSGHAFSFGINHFAGTVHYSADGFLEKNLDSLSPDFVNLMRTGSTNTFVSGLFAGSVLATESHPKDDRTIVKAQLPTKPIRAPSMKRPNKRKQTVDLDLAGQAIPEGDGLEIEDEKQRAAAAAEEAYKNMEVATVMDQLYLTLRDLNAAMTETRLWQIIHLRPNDTQEHDNFDPKRIKAQVRALLLGDITVRRSRAYTAYYTFDEFLGRYEHLIESLNLDAGRSDRLKVEAVVTIMGWSDAQAYVGKEFIWLTEDEWKELEDGLRAAEKEERGRAKGLGVGTELDSQYGGSAGYQDGGRGGHPPDAASAGSHDRLIPPRGFGEYYDDGASYMSEDEYGGHGGDGSSQYGESEWGGKSLADGYGPNTDLSKMVDDYENQNIDEQVEEVPITAARLWWVRFVWLMTWWIPSPFLRWFGKMKREDVQMAWREKVTLCMMIFLMSAFILFFILFFGNLICPGAKTLYTTSDVAAHNQIADYYINVRGKVYDMTHFVQTDHAPASSGFTADKAFTVAYAGLDLSYSFPIPLTQGCYGLVTDDNVAITPNTSATITTFVHRSGNSPLVDSRLTKMKDPLWYWNTFLPVLNPNKKGDVVYSMKDVTDAYANNQRKWLVISGKIYDLSDYFATADANPTNVAGVPNYHYLATQVEQVFKDKAGMDATDYWFNKLKPSFNTTDYYQSNMDCLNTVFYVGMIDIRYTVRCQFADTILLVFAALMCLVIGVKFLAALQLGTRPTPEDHDKFVICQVPCYTEGEESLKKTIDSLTALTYDDKRKLLFLIADGMVMGSGNDRPTPRVVLDILGVDPKMDPEPLMFKSIGEGSKQLNYGKVYSGLYECEGHVVPYIVVVKVGKASERSKPGNRGKRDSQIICMKFLNRVHFDSEMTPLELEVYHQMKNVIGVNPSFYEYVLMVDADTEVMPDSLNRMISCMLHDGRIIGICGETKLVNEDNSWTTMIQVYEYYISHHLSKAFESLFGSVTCLPGCFCMYRIRTPTKSTPLIISNKVIGDYQDNHVDTLHKKNLLHLGEDRYLTTLMMKHFPQYKMTFTPHAQCMTAAPDRWSILLSQRRRWINSTIHNLMEVVMLPELCGFCCFSMRFVVLIDLFGTLTLPSTVIYLIYLVYLVISNTGPFPLISVIMLAIVYGLQAVIFIIKRQWQHVGWMIIYILAFPLFSFLIPVYAFWHFDDFSWGNTRVVVGDNKKKQIIIAGDDEKFDDKMIPMKKWSTYEQELWEVGSTGSRDSRGTHVTSQSYHSRAAGSVRGGAGAYETGSQYGGSQAGGEYDYYRDTNVAQAHDRRGRSRSPAPELPYARSVAPASEYGGDYLPPPQNRGSRAYSVQSYGPDMMTEVPRQGSIMYSAGGSDFEPLGTGRPTSNYSMGMPGMPMTSMGGGHIDGLPSDDEILTEIRNILVTANLMSITKKQVREQLSMFFGVDLTPKKEFINQSIEYILQGKL